MFYALLVILIIWGEWRLKSYFEAVYDFKKQKLICKDTLRLRKYHNSGAFLNIMETKKKLLHAISILFTIIIAIFFLLTLCRKGNRALKLGLSLLLGGAFSNTYDRLTREYVVDYFSFCSPWDGLNRIVFNLSDFCILIGTLITVLTNS